MKGTTNIRASCCSERGWDYSSRGQPTLTTKQSSVPNHPQCCQPDSPHPRMSSRARRARALSVAGKRRRCSAADSSRSKGPCRSPSLCLCRLSRALARSPLIGIENRPSPRSLTAITTTLGSSEVHVRGATVCVSSMVSMLRRPDEQFLAADGYVALTALHLMFRPLKAEEEPEA